MKRKVRVSAAAALAVVPLVLAGCGSAPQRDPVPAPVPARAARQSRSIGGNLVIDRSNDAVSMNKTTTFDNSSILRHGTDHGAAVHRQQ